MEKLLNKIICGDCIEVLDKVPHPFADLIFADPPFNIGYKYDKYHDKVKSKNYIAWTKDWMTACKKVLKPHGSFYIAIGDEYAANIKVIADELGLVMRNWIIWHYTFGQQTKAKFARSHTHIFYFANDEKHFTFNDHAIRVPSDRQLTYNDKRANPAGKIPNDVWTDYSRVCGTFKERLRWHPCQMPQSLLTRIIVTSSNKNDCVLDPFSGSATTAAAAYQLQRNYTGIEMSEKYVQQSEKRLVELKKQRSSTFTNTQGSLFGDGESITAPEMGELQRLLFDIKIPPKKIVADKNLLNLFKNQISLRTDNQNSYTKEKIMAFLENSTD